MKRRSMGDEEQRAYGFAYDAAKRLLKADSTQNTGDGIPAREWILAWRWEMEQIRA